MNRKMTAPEKTFYKSVFTKLDVNAADVSGEATQVYNCISWTVGVITSAIWPGHNISDFDLFYQKWGFTRESQGEVAAWGYSFGEMTHGCISGTGHGPKWESKCGSGLRIQHGLTELDGSDPAYGRVVAFYRKPLLRESRAAKISELLMKERRPLSKEERALLKEEISQVNPVLKSTFDKNFRLWKETWFRGPLALDSNPRSRRGSFEFFRLLSMGEMIIPLVVNELVNPDNFIALQLYDRLQYKPTLLIEHNAEDDFILEGEQGRAQRTVRTYLRNR